MRRPRGATQIALLAAGRKPRRRGLRAVDGAGPNMASPPFSLTVELDKVFTEVINSSAAGSQESNALKRQRVRLLGAAPSGRLAPSWLALTRVPHQAVLQQQRRSFTEPADGVRFMKWVEEQLLAALPSGPAVSVQDKRTALQRALAGATAEAYTALQRKRPSEERQPTGCVGWAAP